MRDALNTPIVFIAVVTVLVLAVAHLSHALAGKAGSSAVARFFALPV